MNNWIPVSEKLPEIGVEVLVSKYYTKAAKPSKGYYVETATLYGNDDWCSNSDEYKMNPKDHITLAWMPLPEPYKENEDD